VGDVAVTDLKNRIKGALFEGMLPLDSTQFSSEIIAGILMAAIFIPEVMGYSRIAGMPIISGIYTILLPMAVFAIFCSSKHTIVGADSATAAIMYGVLITVAVPESQDYMALASLVAILCGIFLIIARFFRLDFEMQYSTLKKEKCKCVDYDKIAQAKRIIKIYKKNQGEYKEI